MDIINIEEFLSPGDLQTLEKSYTNNLNKIFKGTKYDPRVSTSTYYKTIKWFTKKEYDEFVEIPFKPTVQKPKLAKVKQKKV